MSKALTILKNDPAFPPYLDFDRLREEGIKHIASLSGDIWTDHNVHDPGITILEVLCYALTDLGYRVNLDVKDLLALNLKENEKEDNFFTPGQMLTCNPLTINDYRKLLIDIYGVRNAWLEIAEGGKIPLYVNCEKEQLELEGDEDKKLLINGLYKIFIETDFVLPMDKSEDPCGKEEFPLDRILNEVKTRLNTHRNLGEDFLDIIVLQDEEISICADIELDPNTDPETAILEAFTNIQNFLSPSLNFYTLQELLDKGKRIEEIFEGRPISTTSHGFIDTEELENFNRKSEIHVSDILGEMLRAEGVRAVSNLLIFNYIDGVKQSLGEKWCLKLTNNYRPVLDPEKCNIRFYKGNIPFSVSLTTIAERLKKRLTDYNKSLKEKEDLDLSVPAGKYRDDLHNYYSIQNEFPVVYGIGKGDLPEDNTSTQRKAQALQLKGYLTFYDQLLADFLMQLTNIRKFFSISSDNQREEELNRTYFNQELSTVPDLDKLLRFDQKTTMASEEVFAESLKTYRSLVERDQAIDKIIWMVENNLSNIALQLDNGRYRLALLDENNKIWLRTKQDYASESEAELKKETFKFLLSFIENYKKINRADEASYTFSVVYNPVEYLSYLNRISESSGDYHTRRNRFLNHLLARFSEDFTDYILLMYALNTDRYDQETIIDHKTKFLSNYPAISSNRGKAFNYLDKQQVWNTKNVSGFEERVAHLMGINNWKRKYLNNFEETKVNQQNYLLLKSHWEEVWLKEAKEAKLPPLTKEKLKNLAHHKANYRPFYCMAEKVYGFNLLDGMGNLVAIHPSTYADEQTRNHKLEAIRKTFIKSEVRKAVPSNQGFYFLFFNDEDVLLLKSTKAYPSIEEAEKDWLKVVGLLADGENYQDLEDHSGLFGFGVGYMENNQWMELARHPLFYATKSQRTKEKKKTIAFFRGKNIPYSIPSSPRSYHWLLSGSEGEELLKSHHTFKNRSQTASAWLKFSDYGKKEANYKNTECNQGFGFEVLKEENLPVATSLWYNSAEERDTAKAKTIELIAEDPLNNCLYKASKGYQYELRNDNDHVFLRSLAIYPTRSSAEQGLQKLENLATEKNNFVVFRIQEKNHYQVGLTDGQSNLLALSVKNFHTLEETEEFVDKVLAFVSHHSVVYADKTVPDCYGFHLKDNQTILLESNALYKEKSKALMHFWQVAFIGQKEASYRKNRGKEGYGFSIVNASGKILANHPFYYQGAKERDDALQEVQTFLKAYDPPVDREVIQQKFTYNLLDETGAWIWLKGLNSYPNAAEATLAFYNFLKEACKIENYKKTKSEDGCQFGFQLIDNEFVIAIHPNYYLTELERNEALEKLIAYIKKNKIKWDIKELPGTWHFNINWENCHGRFEVLLEGKRAYEKECDALKDAEQLVKEINKGSAPINLVEPQENNDGYGLDVVAKIEGDEGNYQIAAVHPKKYEFKDQAENTRSVALEFLKENYNLGIDRDETFNLCVSNDANAHVKDAEGKFFEPEKFDVYNLDYIARHCKNYGTPGERNKVFDLVDKKRDNWKITAKKEGNFYKIEITCILDDEKETLIFKGVRCYNCWEEVEEILPQVRQKEMVYLNDDFKVQYSFLLSDAKLKYQLADQNQPVAVHPYRYHSKCERDHAMEHASKNLCSGWPYTAIRLMCSTKRINGKFHFSLVDSAYSDEALWVGYKAHNSKEEAEEDCNEKFKLIIEKSLYRDNYVVKESRIYLQDTDKKVLAIIPGKYKDCGEEDEAIKTRMDYAKYFPVKWDKEAFYYEVGKFESGKIDWKSNEGFDTYEAAVNAFNVFLSLLKYRGGYKKTDNKETCNFGFELREVFLESKEEYFSNEFRPPQDEDKDCIPYLWDGVKTLLSHAQEDYAIYPYVNYQQNCEYSFKIVTDAYRLARHSRSYLTREEREQTRDWLFQLTECSKLQYSNIEIKPCFKNHSEGSDNLESNAGLYYLLIKNFKSVRVFNDDDEWVNGELEKPLWKGIKGYEVWDTEEARPEAMKILQHARVAEAYRYVEEGNGMFRLILLNNKGDTVATSFHKYPNKDLLEKAKELRLIHAIFYPFVLDEATKEYRFYLRVKKSKKQHVKPVNFNDCIKANLWKSDEIIYGEDLWEGNLGYDTFINAQATFLNFWDLLKTKTNYGRLDQSGCGPFSIELLDNVSAPSAVLACHPHSYPLYAQLEEAIKRTLNLLNSEGFHLLEHILLRPQEGSKLLPICPDCDAAVPVENIGVAKDPCLGLLDFEEVLYIPGADPYSFWVTIVLPYWPKRFQNTNFRSFFEDTLRREAPAHLALRIGWISPEQMKEFENRFKSWLEVYGNNGNCNLLASQNNLTKYLSELNNVYPPARFPSGNGQDTEELIILGEVKLD